MTLRPLKSYLVTPGPTPVPDDVRSAMAAPAIHHRTPEFSEVLGRVRERLRAVFETGQEVLTLAASGTGAMEAAVSNCFSPGDAVVCVNGGKFGERWVEIARAYGLDVVELVVEWGRAVDPGEVERALRARPEVRGVLMQASETSTTVLHPVEPIARLTRDRDTLLVVDGITAVGVTELPMDRWGIDVLISGSQKAFMLPPGLAFIALSERAWRAAATARCPRYYFDLRRERESAAKGSTAYTPAISLVMGLDRALERMLAEGLPALFARQEVLARATRAAVEALGLERLAREAPSPAVTGFFAPPAVPGGALQRYLRDALGVEVAGGQGRLKGKLLRLAHLGFIGPFDVVTGVAAVEMGLARFGADVALGRGVGAAQRVLADALPPAPA